MRKLLRIVVPLVILSAVAVWWMSGEQSVGPATTRVDSPMTASSQEAWRLSNEKENGRNIARSVGISAPTAKTAPSSANAPDGTPAPARLRWDGPASARGGVPFTVTLRMSSTEPVRVVRMEVGFDPNLLEVVSVRAGDYLADADLGYSVGANGSLRIGATKEASAPIADAPLVMVTFKPTTTSAGTAELSFSSLFPEGPETEIAYENVLPFTTLVTP
jgi:hypothetical protein